MCENPNGSVYGCELMDKSSVRKIGDIVVGDPGSEILHPSNEGASMKDWELQGSGNRK